MVLSAVLRDPARHSVEARRRARDVLGHPRFCCFVPWLDTSRVRSTKYRPVLSLVLLVVHHSRAWRSAISAPSRRKASTSFWARVFTAYYFAHFLLVMPIVGIIETPCPCRGRLPKPFSARGGGKLAAHGRRQSGKAIDRRPSQVLTMVMTRMHKTLAAASLAALLFPGAFALPAIAAGEAVEIKRQKWSFGGVFGHSTRRSFSAGFRSTRRCARTVMA